jgi:hypothetical protein
MILGVTNPVPVPHDLAWYWVMCLIIAGGAVTVWGMNGFVSKWLEVDSLSDRAITILGDLAALTICIVAGGLVGWRVWDAVLGGACGLLGGLG